MPGPGVISAGCGSKREGKPSARGHRRTCNPVTCRKGAGYKRRRSTGRNPHQTATRWHCDRLASALLNSNPGQAYQHQQTDGRAVDPDAIPEPVPALGPVFFQIFFPHITHEPHLLYCPFFDDCSNIFAVRHKFPDFSAVFVHFLPTRSQFSGFLLMRGRDIPQPRSLARAADVVTLDCEKAARQQVAVGIRQGQWLI